MIEINLWSPKRGTNFSIKNLPHAATASFRSSDKLLVMNSDWSLELLDLQAQVESPVSGIEPGNGSNDNMVVSSLFDPQAYPPDIDTGPITDPKPISGMVLSPNQETPATTSRSRLVLWDFHSGRLRHSLDDIIWHPLDFSEFKASLLFFFQTARSLPQPPRLASNFGMRRQVSFMVPQVPRRAGH